MTTTPGGPRRAPNRFGLTDTQITSVSGSVSGFAATFAKQPIQRIKWMRQVEAGATVPYNIVLRRTIEVDGVLGLFRGAVAGIMRNVPHSALVYTIYPQCEAIVLQQQQQLGMLDARSGGGSGSRTGGSGGGSSGGGSSSGSGGSSGGAAPAKVDFSTRFWAGYATLFMATVVTHPLDTLRVRISVTNSAEATTSSMIRSVFQSPGGVRSLYQGFGATLIGAGPRGALGFGVFETLKDVTERSTHLEWLQSLHPASRKLLFGYLAGLVAETAIYPLDTVRRCVRLRLAQPTRKMPPPPFIRAPPRARARTRTAAALPVWSRSPPAPAPSQAATR